ncbi:MAG TPA: AMP-binding protein, partial [Microbacterium sp.]|nr:AMP-binding protein [Microbacterium sp.]
MHNHGLGAWMAKRRLKTPDKPALIHGDGETITYRQLADGTDRVSALLWHRGVRKGDRVAFLGENSPEFLQVLFGAAQLGAVFVPINTRLAPPEIAHVLSDSGARVLIHDPEFAERVAVGVAQAGVPHVIVTGAGGLNGLLDAASGGHADADVTLDDPAALLYTSGTTGRPKGAVLTHQNLTWVALNCLVDYDVVSTDVALMISPLFHAASLGMGAL